MRHHGRTVRGIVATQPLTARRKVLVKRPAREPTISRDVEERIRIEYAHDTDAVPVFVGEAIRLELEIQGHDHACVVCGRRLLEEVICPDCGTVPEWVRQPKGERDA
jgi:hypothetical protein